VRYGRRQLVVAALVAALLGFAAGWLVQKARQPSLEDRMKEKAEDIRHRTEELLR
jgi:hypothetical protein